MKILKSISIVLESIEHEEMPISTYIRLLKTL